MTNLLDRGTGSHLQGDLRYAINTADTNADLSNEIVFAPGLGGTITLTQGPLTIGKNLRIDGPGEDLLTISGNHRSGVLDITADPRVRVVDLSGLTLADGTGVTMNGRALGGGLFNDHARVTLSDCTVTGNTVADGGNGGGIDNETGMLTLNNSTVTGNSIAGTGFGGGIQSHGALILNASTVTGNSVAGPFGGGGGVASGPLSLSSGGGTLTVNSSVIAYNQAGSQGAGGGLYLEGPTTVADSTIAGNTADGQGGGIYLLGPLQTPFSVSVSSSVITGNTGAGAGLYNNDAVVTIADTTVADNTASAFGTAGGLENALSSARMTVTDSVIADNTGNGVLNIGQLTMSGSTISGNTTTNLGGGLEAGYGNAELVNCTISGNSAAMSGGGIAVQSYAAVELTSVTITGNVANGDGTARAGGGGLDVGPYFIGGSGRAILRNTLVAGNSSANVGPDAFGPVISLGYNLVGEADDSTGWTTRDLTGSSSIPLDPMLGPLQDNGGPTPTHALLAGSPAIETGDPTLFGSVDQRGTVRFHSGINPPVDIGAFDAGVRSGFRLLAPSDVVAGEPFALTVVVLDAVGNVASTFTGTIHFSSTDFDAGLPADYTFAPGDAGAATFTVTLQAVGAQQVGVNDVNLDGFRAAVMVNVTAPPTAKGGFVHAADVAFAEAGLDGLGLPFAYPGRRNARNIWH